MKMLADMEEDANPDDGAIKLTMTASGVNNFESFHL
jgi:hypothetical protein